MDFRHLFEKGKELTLRQFNGISWYVMLEMICVILMITIVVLLISYLAKRKINWPVFIGFVFLVIYLCFVYQITYYNRDSGSRTGIFMELKNISLKNGDVKELIYSSLNVILFIPIGIALGLVWSKKRGLFRVVTIPLYGLLGSTCIECAQFVSQRGYFEAQDIVANTLGAVIGGLLTGLVVEIGKLGKKEDFADEYLED